VGNARKPRWSGVAILLPASEHYGWRIMSSSGASIAALAGRGSSVSSANSDYRIVLPPLPSGAIVRNSVLLHGDVSAHPYKIGDFRAEMERLGVNGHIEALGAYQMNHLWMVTFKTEEAKLRLVTAKELEVKGKRCIVVDPENADVRMKLQWLPFHASDETVRRALEPFGKVQDLKREKWQAEGFIGVQSTTRLVRLSLKEGVTLERIPHQLRIAGGNVLVVMDVIHYVYAAKVRDTFDESVVYRDATNAIALDMNETTASVPTLQ
ncbi:uncharacterized protein ISCGN_019435, partial [Ixodes scapularis]